MPKPKRNVLPKPIYLIMHKSIHLNNKIMHYNGAELLSLRDRLGLNELSIYLVFYAQDLRSSRLYHQREK